VAKAIAEIRAEGNKLAAYGLAEAMKEAEEAAKFARNNRNAMANVKACELRAKLSELLIDRLEITPPVDLRATLLEARSRVFTIIAPLDGKESATRVLTAGPAPSSRAPVFDD
jgi:hypothetical protein